MIRLLEDYDLDTESLNGETDVEYGTGYSTASPTASGILAADEACQTKWEPVHVDEKGARRMSEAMWADLDRVSH